MPAFAPLSGHSKHLANENDANDPTATSAVPFKCASLSSHDALGWGKAMERREFITALGLAAIWPLAARAQNPMPAVGFLGSGSPDAFAQFLIAFREGLKDSGYTDPNVGIEYRWAEGHYDRLPALAAELVGRRVTTIVASGLPAAVAAKATTSL